MANRYPLILNAAAGQLQELPTGDSLDLGGESILGVGNLTVTGALVVPLGAFGTPSLTFTGDLNTGIYSPGADQLAVATNGTQRLTIDSSGRLLAGTATARRVGVVTAGFELIGDVDKSAISSSVYSNDSAGPYLSLGKSRGVSDGSYTIVTANDQLGNITFAGADGSTLNSIGASITANVDGTPGANDMPGRLVFSTTADGGSAPSERLRITSAGLVGIGTSSPGCILSVSGAPDTVGTTNSANFSINNPGLTVNQINSTTIGIGLGGIASNSGGDIHLRNFWGFSIDKGSGNLSSGASNTVNADARTFAIRQYAGGTTWNTQFCVNDSGNVGIGDTGPDSTLTIKAAAATTPLRVSGPSSEFARIDSSGRLLVGTGTSPSVGVPASALFVVQGYTGVPTGDSLISLQRGQAPASITSGAQLGGISFGANDGSPYAQIHAATDGAGAANDYPGRLVFSTTADGAASPTERMRINSTGQILAGALGTAALPIISFLNDPNTGVFSPGADQLAVATNGTGRLFIDATGNVNAPVSFRVGNGPTAGALSVQAVANGNLHIRDITAVTGFGAGVAFDVLNDAGSTVQDLAFRGATTSFRNSAGETLRITSTGALNFVGAGTAGSTQAVSFNGSAPVNSLVIDSSGRLGIGTSSPGTTAEIRGTANTAINSKGNLFVADGGTAAQTAEEGGQISFGAWLNGDLSAPYPVATIKGVTESSTTNINAGALLFGTSNAGTTINEWMRITSAGLVGIGTASPGEALTVVGNINLGVLNTSTARTISTPNCTTTSSASLTIQAGQAVTNSGLGASGGGIALAAGDVSKTSAANGKGGSATVRAGDVINSGITSSDGSGGGGSLTLRAGNNPCSGSSSSSAGNVFINGGNLALTGGSNGNSGSITLEAGTVTTNGNGWGGSYGIIKFNVANSERARIDSSGRLLVGTIASPAHQLQVSTDSAGKPSTNTWTIVSDERIKEEIELADLDLCYQAVKTIPLKRFKWKDEVYTEEQVRDRRKLGWIAQDVEAVFPKAVGTYEFKYNQVFEETIIPAVEEILDDEGNVTTPAQPERIEKGELISEDVIEDCRDLNSDQLYAAMYGAIQKLMVKVETLEAEVVLLKAQ